MSRQTCPVPTLYMFACAIRAIHSASISGKASCTHGFAGMHSGKRKMLYQHVHYEIVAVRLRQPQAFNPCGLSRLNFSGREQITCEIAKRDVEKPYITALSERRFGFPGSCNCLVELSVGSFDFSKQDGRVFD